MRKFIIAFISCFFIFTFTEATIAADALLRMLHADEVESFKKDQDALIVGKLTGKQGVDYEVSVLKVLNGQVSSDVIIVTGDFTYGWRKPGEVPKLQDFCVMSLKKVGENYNKAWGIFKADRGDYKSLKLDAAKISGDVAAIEWYVNSGGTQNDFYFDSGTAYARQPNGQSIQIYPKTDVNNVVPKTLMPEPQLDKSKAGSSNKFVIIGVASILIAVSVIVAWHRKGG